MYQFCSSTRFDKTPKLRTTAASFLASAALLTAAMPAYAASSSAPQTRQEISQTRISVMKGSEVTSIDWRQPEMKLKFDLAESDWIDGVDFILSMTPQGNVSRKGPILVSLNNSAPLKMHPYGKSFDARLRFDESFVRAKGNVITIRVPAPDGAPCLTSAHGQWDVNTKKSSIVVRTRAKNRSFLLREVADRLQNPTTAPKTVSLLASGSQKSRLEMLAAQGIALQTTDIPNFKTTAGRSDMQVIIGRRDELAPRVSDRNILSETGPKLSVHEGRPMRLVITGDTDAEVLRAAKAFATHELPAVRRRETSSGEMTFQTAFANTHSALEGKTRFGDINQSSNAMDWRGTPNTLTFNVSDPTVKSGNVLLRLTSGKKISKDSRVEVELNGKSLGFTTLDRKRKSVNFEIPEGALQGSENTLKIIPTLEKNPTVETFGQSCPSMDDLPGFVIGNGSRIEITSNGSSPASELSHLTSDGGLFAEASAANTHIVLTSKSQNDRGATLELLAKLARTSGSGWTEATVSYSADYSGEKNVLVIGPKAARSGLLGGAPRALTAALKGQVSSGALVANTKNYEKFAAADAAKTMQIYAAKTRAKTRIGSGGVAAVYPEDQRIVAVISSTPGRSFSSVTKDLIEENQWNNLTGSVSRWNSKTVLMAQTAIPTPNLSRPNSSPDLLPRFDMAWMEDRFLNVSARAADLKDTASDKFTSVWIDIENRLAGTSPAQRKAPKTVELKTPAPVYVAEKTKRIAKAKLSAPLDKVAAVSPKASTSSIIKTDKLIAPLRGFSNPNEEIRPNSNAPKWLTGLVSRIHDLTLKSETYTDNLHNKFASIKTKSAKLSDVNVAPLGKKIKNALQSDSNPVNKMMKMTDRTFGFAGLLMSLALLIMVLIMSLFRPSNKGSETH